MDRNVIKARSLQRKRTRIRKKVAGTAACPRLTVYRSEKHIYAQLIDDEAGKTLASASTQDKALRDGAKDLDPTAAAKAVGEAIAERASAAGIAAAVFDRGGRRYAGRVAALADGARSKGLQF